MNIERATELKWGWYYVSEDGQISRTRPLLGLGFYDTYDYAEFVGINFKGEGDSDSQALAEAVEDASEDGLDAIEDRIAERLQSAGDYLDAVLRSAEDVLGVHR